MGEKNHPRRNASSNTLTRLSALEELKKAKKEGKSLLSSYKADDHEIFEEVDESVYDSIVQRRLKNADDFVVDDDGQGYMETGLEIWDQPHDHVYSSNDEAEGIDPMLLDESKRLSSLRHSEKQKRHRLQSLSKNPLEKAFANATARTSNQMFSEVNKPISDSIYQSLLQTFDEDNDDKMVDEDLGYPKGMREKIDYSEINSCKSLIPSNEQILTKNSAYLQIPAEHMSEEHFLPSDFSLVDSSASVTNLTSKSVSLCEGEENDIRPLPSSCIKLPIKKVASTNTSSLDRENFKFLLERSSLPPTIGTLSDLKHTISDPKCLSDSIHAHTLPVIKNLELKLNEENNESSIDFYWMDAYDKQNGTIILIGKVQIDGSFYTASLTVKGIQRSIFILPREKDSSTGNEITFPDLYSEIAKITSELRITKFACKMVTRKYAFEIPEIPYEADWVKLVYSYEDTPLKREMTGRTFSHLFGCNAPPLEHFLIKRRIMGPCWLRIAQATWCKFEIETLSPKNVNVLSEEDQKSSITPTLVLMSLSLKSIINDVYDSSIDGSFQLKNDPGENFAKNNIEDNPTKSNIQQRNLQEILSVAMTFTTLSSSSNNEITTEEVSDRERYFVTREVSSIIPTVIGRTVPTLNDKASGIALNSILGRTKIERCLNERSLLSYVLALIQRMDPDMIVGHNITGFDLPLLLNRLKALKIDRWSRMGRLSLGTWPISGYTKTAKNYRQEGDDEEEDDQDATFNTTFWGYAERTIFTGRLICDTYLGAKETVKAKNYSLLELSKAFLSFGKLSTDKFKHELSGEEKKESLFVNHPVRMSVFSLVGVVPVGGKSGLEAEKYTSAKGKNTLTMIRNTTEEIFSSLLMISDCSMSLAFGLQLLQLSRQLTILAGNLWSHTLLGNARSERNEYLLLHHFHGEKFVIPDKEPQLRQKEKRKHSSYTGGLVLPPKTGLYENCVLLLDFNSLYPSIIQEYNICFTTFERTNGKDISEVAPVLGDVSSSYSGITTSGEAMSRELAMAVEGTTTSPPGILPKILATLVARRRAVKNLLGSCSERERASLHIRQQALKLTANSMYGCLGYVGSRFCARPIAEMITALGRSLLMESANIVSKEGFNVIYGDTDSLMIDSNTAIIKEAMKIGIQIKKAINERHHLIEIDMESIFVRLLLLKKKKYAALILTDPGVVINQLDHAKAADLLRINAGFSLADLSMRESRNESEIGLISLQQGTQNGQNLPSDGKRPPSIIPTSMMRLETKGLDMVRRDWCKLSVDVSK